MATALRGGLQRNNKLHERWADEVLAEFKYFDELIQFSQKFVFQNEIVASTNRVGDVQLTHPHFTLFTPNK